ncbi:Dolichyldiphosphatase 1 [Homalodisca vitripennis]|nr:Dolichyldiphosphatase 1 [Homalodisca vitripennis]
MYDDWLGKLFAIASLSPFGILSGFVALILFRRDLHTIMFFLGTLLNEMLNQILKHTICEIRPVHRSMQTLYSEYGMPSAHSQFVWFFATYVIYFVFISLYIKEVVVHVDKEQLERGHDFHTYNTRHASNFYLPLHHTALFERKPSYMGRKIFNHLPENIKMLQGQRTGLKTALTK